jgi:predicted nucleic-acid-binding protein
LAIIEVIQKFKNNQISKYEQTIDKNFIDKDLYIANNPIINKIIKKYTNRKGDKIDS